MMQTRDVVRCGSDGSDGGRCVMVHILSRAQREREIRIRGLSTAYILCMRAKVFG